MTDREFAALVAKTRAPDALEQLREFAKRYMSLHILDVFMETVNVAAYADDDGQFSEVKAAALLGRMFPGADAGAPGMGSICLRARGIPGQ